MSKPSARFTPNRVNKYPKAGRPVGAISFTSISGKDLMAFAGQRAMIPVSRKWLESMGVDLRRFKMGTQKIWSV